MKKTYVILGYGIPKDILVDRNYQNYLRIAFNTIYRDVAERGVQATVICSGGPTDMFKPYRRTEADEMVRALRFMLRTLHPAQRKQWKLVAERRSISTLENLLFTVPAVRRTSRSMLFCEQTRVNRITNLAGRIYGRRVQIVPIDFDSSSSRYLDPKFLAKKERKVLKYDLWALMSLANRRQHHTLFQRRTEFLRQAGTKRQQQAIRKWWEQNLQTQLMK